MKSLTLKEAHTNFSALTRKVDSEGIVSITKYGKEKYIMMTKEVYDGKDAYDSSMHAAAEKGLWVRDEEGICRIRIKGDTASILKMIIPDGEGYPYSCSQVTVPASSLRFVKGDPVEILCSEERNVKYVGIYPLEGAEQTFPEERKLQKEMEAALSEYHEKEPQTTGVVFKGSKFLEV